MKIEEVANGYYQRVSKKCASCRYKDIENDGTRVCLKMGLKVEQTFCCQQWQMSDGLKRAGRIKMKNEK